MDEYLVNTELASNNITPPDLAVYMIVSKPKKDVKGCPTSAFMSKKGSYVTISP